MKGVRRQPSCPALWQDTLRRGHLRRGFGFAGEEVDGCIGPETLGAAAKCNARTLVNDLADRQSAYYRPLPDFPTFGTGWLNRTEARRRAALAMVGGTETATA